MSSTKTKTKTKTAKAEPKTLSFDVDALTFDDLEAFEDATGGANMLEVIESGAKSAKVLKAFFWIVKRQSDPSFTLEDAGKASIGELNALNEALADGEEEEAPSS